MAFDYMGLALQFSQIIIIIIGAVMVIGAIVGFMFWKQKNKLYSKNKVIIWKRYTSKETGEEMPIVESLTESGAIIKDKKMNKWVFHLKHANLDMGEEELANFDEDRSLDIPSVPYSKGGDVVFIEKVGNRKYAFGEPYILDGKVKIRVSEADVAEAKRDYAIFCKTFGKKESPLWAFLAYVTFAVLIMILIFVVLNKFEYVVEASKNFADGARAVSSGAAVPSGAPT